MPDAQENGEQVQRDDQQGDVTSPQLDEGAKSVIDKERKAHKEAAREAAELRAKLQAFEDRDKSEAQKQAEAIAKIERRAADAEARLKVAETSSTSGVPADLLSGPGDDLTGWADRLKEWAKGQAPKPAAEPTEPVPSMTGQPQDKGSVPIAAQISAAEKAGDKALVSRLKAIQLGMAKPTN